MLSLKDLLTLKHADAYSPDMEVAAIVAQHVLDELDRQRTQCGDLEAIIKELSSPNTTPVAVSRSCKTLIRQHTTITLQQVVECTFEKTPTPNHGRPQSHEMSSRLR